MAINPAMRKLWLEEGRVKPKGTDATITPAESVGMNPRDDPFFHATYDRMVAYRYAHGNWHTGGGVVLMLDLQAIKESVGEHNVLDVSSAGGRAATGLKESHRSAFFARKDLELLIRAGELSQVAGHIVTALDIGALEFPERMITINEAMTIANSTGLRIHNGQIASAFESTRWYKRLQHRIPLCPRECLILSIDGSRQKGEKNREEETTTMRQNEGHANSERRAPSDRNTDDTMQTMDTARRQLASELVGERGTGAVIWLFWPREETNDFSEDTPLDGQLGTNAR